TVGIRHRPRSAQSVEAELHRIAGRPDALLRRGFAAGEVIGVAFTAPRKRCAREPTDRRTVPRLIEGPGHRRSARIDLRGAAPEGVVGETDGLILGVGRARHLAGRVVRVAPGAEVWIRLPQLAAQ